MARVRGKRIGPPTSRPAKRAAVVPVASGANRVAPPYRGNVGAGEVTVLRPDKNGVLSVVEVLPRPNGDSIKELFVSPHGAARRAASEDD